MSDLIIKKYRRLPVSESIFFVDLDHTLIDTTELEAWMRSQICRIGYSEEQVESTYLDSKYSRKGVYNIQDHLIRLGSADPLAEVARLFPDSESTDDFVFTDTIDFLRSVSDYAACVLFTFGDMFTQELKARICGLSDFFDAGIFTLMPKPEIVRHLFGHRNKMFQYQERYLIDDHPEAFSDEIDQCLTQIRLRRPGTKYASRGHVPNIIEVSGLMEALDRTKPAPR